METEAQRRANAGYRKRSVKQLIVRFWPKDEALYEYAKARGGATWLRELAQREYESSRR